MRNESEIREKIKEIKDKIVKNVLEQNTLSSLTISECRSIILTLDWVLGEEEKNEA